MTSPNTDLAGSSKQITSEGDLNASTIALPSDQPVSTTDSLFKNLGSESSGKALSSASERVGAEPSEISESLLEGKSSSPAHSDTKPSVMDNAWPVDVHVIGKDIVRYFLLDSVPNNSFHCIFWPAFLMAASIHLPRQILVHGHWILNGQKMSKSLGNVVSPSEVLDNFHPDVIRYYMIKEGGQEGDGNWNTNSLRNRYTYLAHTWGNLISRMMSPKMDLRVAVSNVFYKGEYQGIYSHQRQEDEKLRTAIETAIDVYRYNMNNLNFEAALSVLDVLLRAVLSHNKKNLTLGESIRVNSATMALYHCFRSNAILFYSASDWRGDADCSIVCSTVHASEGGGDA
jgi:methionyl-tRNA synthetase